MLLCFENRSEITFSQTCLSLEVGLIFFSEEGK